MKYFKSQFTLLLLLSSLMLAGSIASDQTSVEEISIQAGDLTLYPDTDPDLLARTRTANFVKSSRALPSSNGSSLDQVYYRVAALRVLDPSLGNLSSSQKQFYINQVLSFQNTNGGFGGWWKDRSSLGNTYKAVQALSWLGHTGLDTVKVKTYLDRLQNTLTKGFNSHLADSDSDVYTTSQAVETYTLLGQSIPSRADVLNLLQNSQNLNAAKVSPSEIGGFGLQTNVLKNIYWKSEVTTTSAVLHALNVLGSNAKNSTEAANYLKNTQTSSGGFVNDYILKKISGSYTEAALEGLQVLSTLPTDSVKAETYLRSLELPNGGFALKTASVDSSLKGTFFGVKGLELLGVKPTNVTKTIEYLLTLPDMNDGFGQQPGELASLRETFDGVAALTLGGRTVSNVPNLLAYLEQYRQTDGGYGVTGSYIDSTSRVINTYDLLKQTVPAKADVIKFIQDRQQTNGGFSKKPLNTTTFVISTFRAVVSLSLLGATPKDVSGAISYLKSTQNTDGGFGGFPGDSSDVSSTYRAVRALSLLGDTSFNKAGAVKFLQDSQNPNGGFKRSVNDVALPKNASSAVYTYSAVRALYLLSSKPSNFSGVYHYVVSLRNNDGGYGKHPNFSSDIAYTFTSLWILKHMNSVTGFSLTASPSLGSTRNSYSSATLQINGGVPTFNYSVGVANVTARVTGVISSRTVSIDTSSMSPGTYEFEINLKDLTGAAISGKFKVYIGSVPLTNQPTSTPKQGSPLLLLPLIITLFGVAFISIKRRT